MSTQGGNVSRRSLLAGIGALACGPRSVLTVGGGVSALACGPATEGDEPMIEPWHMWGGQASVNAQTLTPGFTYRTEGQLARIEYKRPESWRFMFFARILESSSASPAIFVVNFNIIPGVGRASFNMKPFERFIFSLPIGTGGVQEKFSTSVNGPVREDNAVVPPVVPTPNVIDVITAQDLQVSFDCLVVLTVPGNHVNAEVGVALAPWHHARPDWNLHKFSGELQGK